MFNPFNSVSAISVGLALCCLSFFEITFLIGSRLKIKVSLKAEQKPGGVKQAGEGKSETSIIESRVLGAKVKQAGTGTGTGTSEIQSRLGLSQVQ